MHVVNQPVKTGWRDGVLYVEVHPTAGELELGGAVHPGDAMRQVVAVTTAALRLAPFSLKALLRRAFALEAIER